MSVTIYKTPSKGYPLYVLVYYQDDQRKREYNADYRILLNRANEVLDDLIEARPVEVGALNSGERSEFMRAKAIVGKINQPLDIIARHYAEAVKILGNDLVIEAAREYAKRHPTKLPPIKITDLVTEFLEEKKKQGRSERHLETLKSHCKRFGDAVCMNIGNVTAPDVNLFLNNLKIGARTRDNIANSINTLFEYSKRKRYWSHAAALPRAQAHQTRRGHPQILPDRPRRESHHRRVTSCRADHSASLRQLIYRRKPVRCLAERY